MPELNFQAIETAPATDDAGTKGAKKGRKSKKKTEELTLPPAPKKFVHRDRIEQVWTDLKLEFKDGFYTINDRGVEKEKGVVAYADFHGITEVRIPFEKIKGLFRTQYVSDMQAEHPLILASMYTVYFEPVENYSVAFAYVDEEQFNILDTMLGSRVTRCYTYHDMADNKRGYTFDHQDFPSLEEQEKYRREHLGLTVERRQEYVELEQDTPEVQLETAASEEVIS